MTIRPPPIGHDIFPVFSALRADQSGIGVVTQLDLTELQTVLAPLLSDPDSDFTASEVVPRPDVANPTVGPHRYTIYVPHDDGSIINVGASRAPFSPGIYMATKTNISLRTYAQYPETSLSLGSPSTIGPVCETGGYTLDTEGAACTVAKYDISFNSLEKNVVVNAKENVNLSANGQVNLAGIGGVTATAPAITLTSTAGTTVDPGGIAKLAAWGLIALEVANTVAPLGANKGVSGTVAATASGANFFAGLGEGQAAALKAAYMAQASQVGTKVLTHAATLTGLVLGFKKTFAEPVPGTSAWATKSGYFKFGIDCLKEVMSILKDTKIWEPPAPSGAPTGIKITSDTTIGMAANGKVSINGDGGVAVTGGFGGVTLSGLSATLSGQTSVGVSSSLGASLKALAGDVSVTSDLKEAKLSGKKDVKVTSEAGKVSVGSEKDAQLTSKSEKAFVHGKTGAYIGAGTGDGFGMAATTSKVEIGAVTSANTFADAKGDGAKNMAVFDASQVKLQSTADSKLTITKTGVSIKTKMVGVNSSGKVYLKGSIVELN